MAGLALLASLTVCGGCILAAATPDRRLAVLGVTLALVGAPLVSVAPPDLLSLAFRETAALTGAYLLWVVTRASPTEHWTGLPTFVAGFVILAFAAGLVLAPALGSERAAPAGLAASAAAVMAALALSAGSRGVLAAGLGAVLLVLSASLAVAGLSGVGGPLDHAVVGAALLAVSTAAAFLAGSEPRAATGPPG